MTMKYDAMEAVLRDMVNMMESGEENGAGSPWHQQAREELAMPNDEPVAAIHLSFDYLDNGQLVATYALPVACTFAPKLYAAPQSVPAGQLRKALMAYRTSISDEAQSRSEFEAWHHRTFGTQDFTRWNEGGYADIEAESDWISWQASRAALKGGA